MPTDAGVQCRDQHESIGALLRQARLARDLSEKEVADRLRITVHYVNALETDRYEKLPGSVFVTGYLKNYANLLEIDATSLVARYKDQVAERQASPHQEITPRTHKRRDYNPPYVAGSLVLFVALYFVLWLFRGTDAELTVDSEGAASEATVAVNTQTIDASTLRPAVGTTTTSSAGPDAATKSANAGSGSGSDEAGRQDEMTRPEARVTDSSRSSSSLQNAAVDSLEVAAEPMPTVSPAEAAVEPAVASNQAPAAALETADSEAVEQGGSGAANITGSEENIASAVATQESDRAAPVAVAAADNSQRLIEIHSEGSDTLRIDFTGASWVEVVDGSAQALYSDLREAGDILEITGHGPFNVLLGDAPQTRLEFNGDEVDVSGDVRIGNTARLTVGL